MPAPVVSRADVWREAGCDPSYENSPLNGHDSMVITLPIPELYAVSWTSDAALPPTFLGGIEVEQVSEDCRDIRSDVRTGASGDMHVSLTRARWLVIHNRGMVNLSFVID